MRAALEYVQRVSRMRRLAREHWFELLVVAMTAAAMLQLVVNRNAPVAAAWPTDCPCHVSGALLAAPRPTTSMTPLFTRATVTSSAADTGGEQSHAHSNGNGPEASGHVVPPDGA